MTRQRQRQLFGCNAAAVVGNGNAFDAALFEPHRYLAGARVQRVLQQFLDHGGRAFDHFAGGNLRNQLIRQLQDGR